MAFSVLRHWCAVLGPLMVLLLGCVARSNVGGSSDGTGGEASDGGAGTSDAGVTSSAPEPGTPTSSPPTTGTMSPEATTSWGSTTEASTGAVFGTWEGVTWDPEGSDGILLHVCGFGDVCVEPGRVLMGCSNIYVRAEGTIYWEGAPDWGRCGGWTLEAQEFLEARACEPSDCADCGGKPSCQVECDVAAQDCPPDDEKCAMRATEEAPGLLLARCVPLPATPLGEGEECTVSRAAEAGHDDCDRGLHCWAEDPDATTGVCVPFCVPSHPDPDACQADCIECSIGGAGLCLPDCPDCDLSHSC